MIEIVTLLWAVIVLFFVGSVVYIYKKWQFNKYEIARSNVFEYVKSYKRRCTGNNRFVVTVVELQDAFREYETPLLEKIHLELINNRIIEKDPMDGEWVVR